LVPTDEIARQFRDQLDSYGASRSDLLRAQGSNAVGGGVVINQQFDAPPLDPHTWSQGVRFNLAASLGI